MTKDGKTLKITCIISLFVGLATIALGIVLAVGNMVDFDAWLTALEGVGTAAFGARSAILANVPSNTSKIRGKSLALLVLAVGVGAYLIYVGTQATIAQLGVAAVICLLAVCALLVSHRIVKEQLRK